MNYIKITHNDIANGPGVRTVLWVAGCDHYCEDCQNPQTWDKTAGKPFNEAAMAEIMGDLKDGYRSGITFSGGDPLYRDNRAAVEEIAKEVKTKYPNTETWLYTGYQWEEIKDIPLVNYVDVLVDGQFEKDKHDITLNWKGSSNQRVIDVKNTLKQGDIVLWDKEKE